MKIILASGSERRRNIFNILFESFIQVVPDIKESDNYIENSILKSKYGLIKFVENNQFNDNILSIGVDTVIIYKNKVFGKFYSKEEVKNFFIEISCKWHYVVSAVTLINEKKEIKTFIEKSKIKFRKLSIKEINSYLDTNEWKDVAGGYRIQGLGGILIEKYKGSFSNIVGFPVEKFLKYYKKLISE